MKKRRITLGSAIVAIALFGACNNTRVENNGASILLKNATVIDGTGNKPVPGTNILIRVDTIAAIGQNLDSAGATVVDLSGKTVLPALTSAHVHIGTLKGTENRAEYYTRENILSQLEKYEDYGITNILSLGSDRPFLFESGFRDSSATGLLPGARIHTAGYGFGVKAGAPPIEFAMDHVYRPTDVEQIPAQMDSLQQVKPEAVKIWVDDFGGKYKKMNPAIYIKVIKEAHKRNLRVAAHAYYLADARQLVANGVDIIGHSIRDSVADDALITQIKEKGIAYIPTLSLDEFSYIYARKPDWINDPFFKASLEPGVYEMITSEKYQNDLKNSPAYERNVRAFEIALKNLKKLYDAGVLVALGTDSGAMPLRAQGFSEHLELELMVQAGLKPLQAITVATENASRALKINNRFGTLVPGKIADLLIIEEDPLTDIRNTRKIFAVYKAGKQVSNGPLSK